MLFVIGIFAFDEQYDVLEEAAIRLGIKDVKAKGSDRSVDGFLKLNGKVRYKRMELNEILKVYLSRAEILKFEILPFLDNEKDTYDTNFILLFFNFHLFEWIFSIVNPTCIIKLYLIL